MLRFLGFYFIDMSAELERRAYEWRDDIGLALREWLEHGKAKGVLVDDHHVLAVLNAAIGEAAKDQPVVIIGCPRTVDQAKLVSSLLAFHARKKNVLAITLEVKLEEAMRRALEGDRERMARVDSTRERVAESHGIFLTSNALICAELSALGIKCMALDADGSKTEVEAALYALVDQYTPLSQITNTH